MKSFAQKLHNSNLGILCIRVALGIVFVHAGWLKVIDMPSTVGFFGAVGIPALLAYAVSYIELIGGILLLAGVWTRYVGIALAVIMIVAIKILLPNGFGLATGGYEYPTVLLLLSFAVITLGSGTYSLSSLIKSS